MFVSLLRGFLLSLRGNFFFIVVELIDKKKAIDRLMQKLCACTVNEAIIKKRA